MNGVDFGDVLRRLWPDIEDVWVGDMGEWPGGPTVVALDRMVSDGVLSQDEADAVGELLGLLVVDQ